MPGNLLELIKPQEFFRSKVSRASVSLNIELDDQLEFYLVNLLCEFVNPSQLDKSVEVNSLDTPLAIMLKKALESSPAARLKILKRLGDTSLYFAGYFQGFFSRKTFDIDYYISMGANAYSSVSTIMKHYGDGHFTDIYQGLSSEFGKLVEILALISDEDASTKDHRNLVAIYERWTKTQCDRLRRILQEAGINPIPDRTKQVQ